MANNDLTLTYNEDNKEYDISFNEQGDFANDNSIQTALLISLFDDKRADSTEIANPILRNGWLGNEINLDGFEQGSKLWLLAQERNTVQTKNQAVEYCKASLQWLLDDGIITALKVTGLNTNQGISIQVEIGYNGITSQYTFNLFERN